MEPVGERHPKAEYILGVDLARMGEDSSVFVILERNLFNSDEHIYPVFIGESKHKQLTDSIGRVMFLNEKFNFDKIYLDATGMGSAVFDILREKLGEWKVEGVVFTAKSKVEMYYNLKLLMQRGLLKLPRVYNDTTKKMFYQLSDLRVEYKTKEGDFKKYESIRHSDRGHDDFCDALALACLHFRAGQEQEYNPVIF